MKSTKDAPPPVLGLRANAAQFTLLVAVNALVGGMLGQERTVLPILATARAKRRTGRPSIVSPSSRSISGPASS